MTMENISKAILDKVKAESDAIIREAEEKARGKIENAREQQKIRSEEEKSRLLAEAKNEAARVKAQTSISTRLELLKAKNEIINGIVSKVKQSITAYPDGAKLAVNLIHEGIQALGTVDADVYVSSADIVKIREYIKKDRELSSKIKEIQEIKCFGGAVIKDRRSGISIDNTYDTRLETLLPRVLPEISKELFGI